MSCYPCKDTTIFSNCHMDGAVSPPPRPLSPPPPYLVPVYRQGEGREEGRLWGEFGRSLGRLNKYISSNGHAISQYSHRISNRDTIGRYIFGNYSISPYYCTITYTHTRQYSRFVSYPNITPNMHRPLRMQIPH